MSLDLSSLKPKKGSKSSKKRVGRGNGSGYGTHAGRGNNGQRSRAGGKSGLKIKGFRDILKRIPKQKGFKSPHKKIPIVNVGFLGEKFESGDTLDIEALKEKGILSKHERHVKVLGEGELDKELTVKASKFSKSAKEKIKDAGGEAIKID